MLLLLRNGRQAQYLEFVRKTRTMIFVTVGTQLPFDRLLRDVDEIAPLFPQTKFVAQVFGSSYHMKHLESLQFISPLQFNDYLQSAELIISHAGIGTITTVAQLGKPLIVFPRLGKLKEHRDDHQVATCQKLQESCDLHVAWNKDDLECMVRSYFEGKLHPMKKITPFASERLISSLKSFLV